MADYDWGQLDQPKPRSSGRRWLWLLLAVVALIIFVRSNAQQQRRAERGARPPSGAPGEATQAERPAPSPSADAQNNGDWSLEEMPGHERPSTPATTTSTTRTGDSNSKTPAPPSSTTEGEWTIEEVPADASASNNPQPGTTDSSQGETVPSKTTEGDWAIEEVKPTPPRNSENQ
jgi:hypothetical protein